MSPRCDERHGLGRIGIVVVRVEFMDAGRHFLDQRRPLLGELLGRNSAFGAGHHVVDADQDIAGENDVVAHAGEDLRPFTKLRGGDRRDGPLRHRADTAGRDRSPAALPDLWPAGLPGRPIGRSGRLPPGCWWGGSSGKTIGPDRRRRLVWHDGGLVAAGTGLYPFWGWPLGRYPPGETGGKGSWARRIAGLTARRTAMSPAPVRMISRCCTRIAPDWWQRYL